MFFETSGSGPEVLKKYRKEKGLTLKEMGTQTNISPTRLNRFEDGSRVPTAEELTKVCDLFKLSEDEKESLFFNFGYIEISD